MTNFRPYEPDQQLLLPPSLRDWIPPDHLVWFISETVDELDLGKILAAYRDGGQGNLPYHPSMMLKILIYAYATGVFSSRRIARHIEENIAFRVLAAGNTPDHRTICRFREQHLAAFERLFVQVVQIARDAGKDQENFTDPESRRGLGKVTGEFNLVCMAMNLRRMVVRSHAIASIARSADSTPGNRYP